MRVTLRLRVWKITWTSEYSSEQDARSNVSSLFVHTSVAYFPGRFILYIPRFIPLTKAHIPGNLWKPEWNYSGAKQLCIKSNHLLLFRNPLKLRMRHKTGFQSFFTTVSPTFKPLGLHKCRRGPRFVKKGPHDHSDRIRGVRYVQLGGGVLASNYDHIWGIQLTKKKSFLQQCQNILGGPH